MPAEDELHFRPRPWHVHTTGEGCRRTGPAARVVCRTADGRPISVFADLGGGDDVITFRTGLPGTVNGGPGADRVTCERRATRRPQETSFVTFYGGPGRDRVRHRLGPGDCPVWQGTGIRGDVEEVHGACPDVGLPET